MNTELQSRCWACLSKEAREEVKMAFNMPSKCGYSDSVRLLLTYIFGSHNLTSDTEPEEMLMVERKKVQGLYEAFESRQAEAYPIQDGEFWRGSKSGLKYIFGDKCLSDKAEEIADKCIKPVKEHFEKEKSSVQVEPKFGVDDYVVIKATGKIHKVLGRTEDAPFSYHLDVDGTLITKRSLYSESDLEPYTVHETKSYCNKEKEICKWIDEHPDVHIIAITQDRMWYTVFYQE